MTKLTAAEVERAISDQYDDYVWEDFRWYLRENGDISIDDVTYPVEVKDEYTGGEGDWDSHTFVVFQVGDQLFRKTGRYRSHYGNDWDGPVDEVEPIQRTVNDWKKVDE